MTHSIKSRPQLSSSSFAAAIDSRIETCHSRDDALHGLYSHDLQSDSRISSEAVMHSTILWRAPLTRSNGRLVRNIFTRQEYSLYRLC